MTTGINGVLQTETSYDCIQTYYDKTACTSHAKSIGVLSRYGNVSNPMSQDGKPGNDGPEGRSRTSCVSRISISLAEDLLGELDRMVGTLGFANRSRAVSTLLHRALTDHQHKVGDRVMVGTVTLFYNHLVPGLQQRLTDLQKRNIDEVISSLHVHLEANQTLEVLLVQGPARKLQDIADEMIAMKGVVSGHLQLAAALIPPVHPIGDQTKTSPPRPARSEAIEKDE